MCGVMLIEPCASSPFKDRLTPSSQYFYWLIAIEGIYSAIHYAKFRSDIFRTHAFEFSELTHHQELSPHHLPPRRTYLVFYHTFTVDSLSPITIQVRFQNSLLFICAKCILLRYAIFFQTAQTLMCIVGHGNGTLGLMNQSPRRCYA